MGISSSIIQSINDSLDRLQLKFMGGASRVLPEPSKCNFDGNWDPLINNCACTNAKVVEYMKGYVDRVIIDDVNTFNEPMYN